MSVTHTHTLSLCLSVFFFVSPSFLRAKISDFGITKGVCVRVYVCVSLRVYECVCVCVRRDVI